MSARPTIWRAAIDEDAVDVHVGADGAIAIRTDGEDAGLACRVTGSTRAPDGTWLLQLEAPDGTPAHATVAVQDETVWVAIDGRAFTVEVEPALQAAPRRRARGDETLGAPMPATVIRVLVEPGQRVARGDTLLLLEAMKMELPVRAARDGVVKAVRCSPGELVQPGVALVDLD